MPWQPGAAIARYCRNVFMPKAAAKMRSYGTPTLGGSFPGQFRSIVDEKRWGVILRWFDLKARPQADSDAAAFWSAMAFSTFNRGRKTGAPQPARPIPMVPSQEAIAQVVEQDAFMYFISQEQLNK